MEYNGVVVPGIQYKKLSVVRQADSIFADEDLIRLGDQELEHMVDLYFGIDDYDEALDHLLKRRQKLLDPADSRSFGLYETKSKRRQQCVRIYLDVHKDADILAWLSQFRNKGEAIKELMIREINDE